MFPVRRVLDITPLQGLYIDMLVIRLLHILAAAVHTSSVTWFNALYDRALHPEVVEELPPGGLRRACLRRWANGESRR